jgi:hypothetical protein
MGQGEHLGRIGMAFSLVGHPYHHLDTSFPISSTFLVHPHHGSHVPASGTPYPLLDLFLLLLDTTPFEFVSMVWKQDLNLWDMLIITLLWFLGCLVQGE